MVTVIVGPPCSGKTSYMRQHAKRGDIVIDFDLMAKALGSPVTHGHTPPIQHVTTMARRAAIQAALTVGQKTDVWIVDCNPTQDRLHSYRQAGAHIVTLTADKDELHRRAGQERPRLWHRLINDWAPPSDEVTDPPPLRVTRW